MREKNGHRLEELGLGRGLEGQPEVLAYHPQTRHNGYRTLELAHLGSNPSSSTCQLCTLGQIN